MVKELSFEFRALMDSIEILDKPLSYEITVQPECNSQKTVNTTLRKTCERGATLKNLLETEGNNGQEIAEYLIDKVFMLEVETYKSAEA